MLAYEIFDLLWKIFLGLSGVCLILAVVIFFKLRIVQVVQDLNGTLAVKEIERIRKEQQKSSAGVDVFNTEIESSTGKTGRTGKTGQTGRTGRTGKAVNLAAGGLSNTEQMSGANNANRGEALQVSSLQNQLSAGNASQGTTLLQSNRIINPDFVLEKNIVFINTSDFI